MSISPKLANSTPHDAMAADGPRSMIVCAISRRF